MEKTRNKKKEMDNENATKANATRGNMYTLHTTQIRSNYTKNNKHEEKRDRK